MQLGTTFSHNHLNGLGINPMKAIKTYNSLGLEWIRLCSYWNEIEKKEGKYDFSQIEPFVEFCEKKNIKTVLTIGMKAPRYPEYYLPGWLKNKINLKRLSSINNNNTLLLDKTLLFLEKTVTKFKSVKAIKVWQVENEPLDPSGPSWWRIDSEFLKKEIKQVKKLDARKVLISFWGNELGKRKLYKRVDNGPDIVGLDLYLRHPTPFLKWFNKYIGPLDSKKNLVNIAEKIRSKSKLWITELQSEPWEPDEIVTKKKNPPSFLPKHFKDNIRYVKDLNAQVILLWGFEFWLWKEKQGDPRYLRAAQETIKQFSS